MSNQKSLLLVIFWCCVFESVYPRVILFDVIKKGTQDARCKLHQIGSKIIHHDHHHGDPCQPSEPEPNHYEGNGLELQGGYQVSEPHLENTETGQGFYDRNGPDNSKPQYLNGHSYGPIEHSAGQFGVEAKPGNTATFGQYSSSAGLRSEQSGNALGPNNNHGHQYGPVNPGQYDSNGHNYEGHQLSLGTYKPTEPYHHYGDHGQNGQLFGQGPNNGYYGNRGGIQGDNRKPHGQGYGSENFGENRQNVESSDLGIANNGEQNVGQKPVDGQYGVGASFGQNSGIIGSSGTVGQNVGFHAVGQNGIYGAESNIESKKPVDQNIDTIGQAFDSGKSSGSSSYGHALNLDRNNLEQNVGEGHVNGNHWVGKTGPGQFQSVKKGTVELAVGSGQGENALGQNGIYGAGNEIETKKPVAQNVDATEQALDSGKSKGSSSYGHALDLDRNNLEQNVGEGHVNGNHWVGKTGPGQFQSVKKGTVELAVGSGLGENALGQNGIYGVGSEIESKKPVDQNIDTTGESLNSEKSTDSKPISQNSIDPVANASFYGSIGQDVKSVDGQNVNSFGLGSSNGNNAGVISKDPSKGIDIRVGGDHDISKPTKPPKQVVTVPPGGGRELTKVKTNCNGTPSEGGCMEEI